MTQRYKFIDPLADEIRSTNKTIVTSQEDLLYPSLYNIDRFRPGYLLEVGVAGAPAPPPPPPPLSPSSSCRGEDTTMEHVEGKPGSAIIIEIR